MTAEEDADPDHLSWFTARAITDEIRQARGYARWTADEITPATDPAGDLADDQQRAVARMAKQAGGGWVITRHAPPLSSPLPRIYPEYKPDKPMRIPGWRHWHGDGTEPEGLEPWVRDRSPKHTRREHPDKDCPLCAHINRGAAEPKSPDDHRGVNTEEIHSHTRYAKYWHIPKPQVEETWTHDHATAWRRRPAKDRPAWRERHVSQLHDGADVQGEHQHTTKKKAAYGDLASRIDVHPMALPRFADAQVAFFGIEGCPKADAMLADGAAVFSVPAVGQWDCPELDSFVGHYVYGKTVIIVCDDDWYEKDEVINSARLCQNRLLRAGVRAAHVAAPPPNGKKKTGVDDFIAAGGHLEELHVIDHAPPEGLYEFVVERCWKYRKDRTWRDAEVLAGLTNFTGGSGRLKAPLQTVAKVLATSRKRVSLAVRDLEAMGAVVVHGDLASRGSWFGGGLDWVERPTIELIPELRSTVQAPVNLGDLIPSLRPDDATRSCAA